jgi:hypothetical protein
LRSILEDVNDSTVDPGTEDQQEAIPLHNVSGNILAKVIEWLEYHKDDPILSDKDEEEQASAQINKTKNIEIKEWDARFLQVDQSILFDIILVRIDLSFHKMKKRKF